MAECPKCGAAVLPGALFCTECGTKLTEEQKTTQEQARTQEQKTAQSPAYSYIPPVIQGDPAANDAVGVGAFFWLSVLFSVPVVGLLACLLVSFVPRRKSLKNFGRASLIRAVIGLLLSGIAALTLWLFLPKIEAGAERFLREQAEEWAEDRFGGLAGNADGGLAGLIGSLADGISEEDVRKALRENGVSEEDMEKVLDALEAHGVTADGIESFLRSFGKH